MTAVRNALLTDDFVSARAVINLLAAKAPKSWQPQYWAGVLCLRTGKPQEAIRCLRAAQKLADDPYNDEALALAYYLLKQFRLFKISMLRASKRIPSASAPYYYLGRYYVSDDIADFEQAENFLTEAVRRAPTNARALYYLGFCQESRRELESAEANYQQVVKLSGIDTSYHASADLGLARLAILQNELASALHHAQKAEEGAPQNAESHSVLAKLYTKTGDTQRAIREWAITASMDPTDTSARYNLYKLYTQTGNQPLADRALEQYKQIAKLYGTK